MASSIKGLLSGTFGCASPGKRMLLALAHVRRSKGPFYRVAMSSANRKVPSRFRGHVFSSFVANSGSPTFSAGMNVKLQVIGGAVSLRRKRIVLSDRPKGNSAFMLLVPRNGSRFANSLCRVMSCHKRRARPRFRPLSMRRGSRRKIPIAGGALLVIRSGMSIHRCVHSLFIAGCAMLRTTSNRRKIQVTAGRVPSLVVSSMVVPIGSKFTYYQRVHRQRRATRVPVLVLATGTRSTSMLRKSCDKTSSCVVGPFGPRMLGTGMRGLVLRHRHLGHVCAGTLVLGQRSIRSRRTSSRFVRGLVRIIRGGLSGRGFGIGVLTRRLRVDRPALCQGMGRHDRLSIISVVQDIQIDGTTSLVVRGHCSVRRVSRGMKFDSTQALEGRFARRFNIPPSGCVRGG